MPMITRKMTPRMVAIVMTEMESGLFCKKPLLTAAPPATAEVCSALAVEVIVEVCCCALVWSFCGTGVWETSAEVFDGSDEVVVADAEVEEAEDDCPDDEATEDDETDTLVVNCFSAHERNGVHPLRNVP